MISIARLFVAVAVPVALLVLPRFAAAACEGVAEEQARAAALASPAERARAYKDIVSRCPQFNTHYNAGRAFLAAGDGGGAISQFAAARSSAADGKARMAAAARLAEAYLEAGRLPDALAALDAARQDAAQAGGLPPWAQDVARRIDTHPGREKISAADMASALGSSRSYGVRPKVDLRIGFEYDKDALDAQGKAQVEELGKLMSTLPADSRLRVIGHTDARGDPTYNQKLSERRAQAVRQALVGINSSWASRLQAEGRGKRELLYTGDSDEDHRLNRRVEISQE